MNIKIGMLLIFLGLMTMPVAIGNNMVTSSTIMFMSGLFFLGIHARKEAVFLSKGNSVVLLIYRTSWLTMPVAAIVVRILFQGAL